jgi:hypothetical protein
MATDRLYTHSGTDAVNGNYETDDTIGSRALRLVAAKRGQWPGGRGRLMGSRFGELLKLEPETENEVPNMVAEAWEPLVSRGEMSDIQVSTEVDMDRTGVLGFEANFTDRTTGDSLSHRLPAPWRS